jgi:enamine deaminase RidA (YjgF/YER057c/UK114 family)
MGPHDILHPATWKRTPGYSNGVAATGRTIFLAGQIGWDGDQQFVSDDLVGQTAQALRNIVDLLSEAGAGPEHIVRLTWYVTDREEYLTNQRELGDAYREVIGKHFPAMTLVQVVALVEDKARVEIEATAVVPN